MFYRESNNLENIQMAFFECSLFSESLGMVSSVNVVLPQPLPHILSEVIYYIILKSSLQITFLHELIQFHGVQYAYFISG